jgi:hypothetical protein
MAQCKGHLRVSDFDEGWFQVVVEVLVRNIRHALPYLLRRLLADTKTNNIDDLSVFSGEIQVEELDTEHNPFTDLIRPLVTASIDLLLAFVSLRKQTNKVMMATIATKRAHIRRAAFSLHSLLHKYLGSPALASAVTSSPFDPIMHRIRRIERLRRLVAAIKRRMQERFWRRPGAFNEFFEAGEVFDLKWIQLINPVWLAFLGAPARSSVLPWPDLTRPSSALSLSLFLFLSLREGICGDHPHDHPRNQRASRVGAPTDLPPRLFDQPRGHGFSTHPASPHVCTHKQRVRRQE